MPGKVNPVIPEATLMVCAQVIGNDAAITTAGAAGNFELNVMMPVIARNLLESIRLLAHATRLLADRCVDGITVDEARMRAYAESSPSVVTPLNRYVGYEKAAARSRRRRWPTAPRSARPSSRWAWSRTAPSPRSSSTPRSTYAA